MNQTLENDLKRCAEMLLSLPWGKQNDKDDKKTNFIYKTYSLDKCLEIIEEKKLNKGYVLHRWYNFYTSNYCEEIFCDYGAEPEENKKNHDVDIRINGTPFDVKLTVYPYALKDKREDYILTTRDGKNSMIEWLYYHQSQESRKQLANRLYVVCDAKNKNEILKMKCDFAFLREQIKRFMESEDARNFNKVKFIDEDNNKEYTFYSDLIYVCK